MPNNKKPPWGPGPPALQAPPSSAEGGKSSRRQPCCCCQWHLSAAFGHVWCTWTLRNSDYPWETRNSTRAMPLLGFTNFGESAWMFSFFSVRGCPARHHEPITVKSWLKKLSLSVNRWSFTDKLFKINNLSVRRRVFTDKIHSVRQRLSGIAEVLTKKMRCVTRNETNTELDWIEQPACRDLVYIIESQEDIMSGQMQVM